MTDIKNCKYLDINEWKGVKHFWAFNEDSPYQVTGKVNGVKMTLTQEYFVDWKFYIFPFDAVQWVLRAVSEKESFVIDKSRSKEYENLFKGLSKMSIELEKDRSQREKEKILKSIC